MNVEIRYFEGCPTWREVDQSIRELIEELHLEAEVMLTLVDTPEKAERMSFRGSPTIVIDGIDPWDDPDAPVGLSCRVYRTEDGFAGRPTKAEMEAALTASG